MIKINFSCKEINIFHKNTNLHHVSEKTLTYTGEFKNKFIDNYQTGKLPRQFFKENDFDLDVIGIKRIE